MSIFASEWFVVFGMPVLICCAGIIDVTMSTVRTIFVAKGQRLLAPLLGFFETLIWFLAITSIMQHLDQ